MAWQEARESHKDPPKESLGIGKEGYSQTDTKMAPENSTSKTEAKAGLPGEL